MRDRNRHLVVRPQTCRTAKGVASQHDRRHVDAVAERIREARRLLSVHPLRNDCAAQQLLERLVRLLHLVHAHAQLQHTEVHQLQSLVLGPLQVRGPREEQYRLLHRRRCVGVLALRVDDTWAGAVLVLDSDDNVAFAGQCGAHLTEVSAVQTPITHVYVVLVPAKPWLKMMRGYLPLSTAPFRATVISKSARSPHGAHLESTGDKVGNIHCRVSTGTVS